jgi:N-acetylmuramoyl-L-alanine amidase
VADVSEHDFNVPLARLIAEALDEHGYAATVIDRYEGKSYGSAMTWLAAKIREIKAAMAIELHFNASDVRAASGHEWLYMTGSAGGREIARCLDRKMRGTFPQLQARGAKALGPSDRGGQFLLKTHCPAVIAEPFFGTNREDWEMVAEHPAALAGTVAGAIMEAMDILTKLQR